jgi:anti-sigma-K factor RskA
MEKERLEALLIEYIDDTLAEADRKAVEQLLASNEEAKKLYEQLQRVLTSINYSTELEPSASLKESFNQLLEREIAANKKSKVVFFTPSFYKVAAAAVLLVVGGGIGYWVNKSLEREQELAEIKRALEENKTMMMALLSNDQSASQRMTGVTVAYQMPKADDEIIATLAKVMNEDPNTNVRMAALEALSKFHQEPAVRKVLIKSLGTQKDPVVQIALIQIMVTMKEKGVVIELERMTEDASTMKAVKDAAYSGLLKLS